ncbi:hypothetical protein MKZ38_001011 [Zalerion maritima]|uniref:Uncharacterized protein n=1 Tax=Zalerion maritima TaxID=339359 RepID=A0AAD5RRG2_9PEZI|nr:hypothetical protein MKZ38_001011 [Zalerion maritima]
MRYSGVAAMAAAALSGYAAAEDLLFIEDLEYAEYTEATETLGMTAKVVSSDTFLSMTTEEFAAYKAIIISDPDCVASAFPFDTINGAKGSWSPAVQGNVVVIGTDPSYHTDIGGDAGAPVLIQNSIKFAAAGEKTGLYYAIGCKHEFEESATIEPLSELGTFAVRGNLDCYNKAHKLADHEALEGLTDVELSDWSCSVHTVFTSFPSSGPGGFDPLASAQDVLGVGSREFSDGTVGLPYILARGAAVTGCGDGTYNPGFEECDHGDANGSDGDLCNESCRCLYGVADAELGECKPAPPGPSSTGGVYDPSPCGGWNTTCHGGGDDDYPPTISCPYIIGVEVIVVIDIHTSCGGSSGNGTDSYCTSTLERPIYETETSGHVCYPCMYGTPTAATDFMTVTTTYCPGSDVPEVTYKKCHDCDTIVTVDTAKPTIDPETCSDIIAHTSPSAHSHPGGGHGGAPTTITTAAADTYAPTTAGTYTHPSGPSSTGSVVVVAGAGANAAGVVAALGGFVAAALL